MKVKKHKQFSKGFIGIFLTLFLLIIFTNTTSTTSDRITFCNKYMVWVDFYKGWLEAGHCN